MLQLFIRLLTGDWFHFYDRPDRLLMKTDNSHYIAPEGRKMIHPFVAVVKHDLVVPARKSIFDRTKDESNGHEPDNSKNIKSS
jgi:hypothetical protein